MRTALSSLMICLLSVTPLHAQDSASWLSYRNERFGLSLSYPGEVFQIEQTSKAGDGVVFAARGSEARMLVGALHNHDRHTITSYQQFVAGRSYGGYSIDYRPKGNTWFVLSGEGSGKIFYEKVIFSCGGRLINSFALIYPSAERAVFDPIVERIEDTFRAGQSECPQGATLPADQKVARTKIIPPSSSQRRPARKHARTEFADRIARSRGTDVLVILRRAGPPYDYRVVRGYASR